MYLAGVINASDAAVVWVVMPLMIVSCVIQAVMTWLPNAETKLMSMALIATNPRSVRIQIEEFKVYVQSNLTLILIYEGCFPWFPDLFYGIFAELQIVGDF